MSLLRDRYVNLPLESNKHEKIKSLLLCLGISDKAAYSSIKRLSAFQPNKDVSRLVHLFETIDFKLEDCHTVARLALGQSPEAVEPHARRYRCIGEKIIDQFKVVVNEDEMWEEQKARWDAGKPINRMVTHAPPYHSEDKC